VGKKPRFPRPFWAWKRTKISAWKKEIFFQGGLVRTLFRDGRTFRGLFFSVPCRIDRVGKDVHLAMQMMDEVRLCGYEPKLQSAIWDMAKPEDFRNFVDLPMCLDDPALFTDFSFVPPALKARMAEELEKGPKTCLSFLLVPKKGKPRAAAGAGRRAAV
jgi:hypothetical protein